MVALPKDAAERAAEAPENAPIHQVIPIFSPALPVKDSESGFLTPAARAFFKAKDRRSVGRWAEELAVSFLVSRGAEIVGRNVRVSHSEIDVVCKESGELVFVEVRCRRANPAAEAADTVGPQKWRSLARGAESFVWESGWGGDWRIDLIAVDVFGSRWELRWLKAIEME